MTCRRRGPSSTERLKSTRRTTRACPSSNESSRHVDASFLERSRELLGGSAYARFELGKIVIDDECAGSELLATLGQHRTFPMVGDNSDEADDQ